MSMNVQKNTYNDADLSRIDYKVYHLSPVEIVMYFLVAFTIGAAVGYLFYGGIGKDSYGVPTTLTKVLNIVIPTVIGSIAGIIYLPARRKQIIENRMNKLRIQFRDLMDTLSTSIGSGKNIPDSYRASYDDLKVQYPSDAYIVRELEIILSGMANNFSIEQLLHDFGDRSGIDDIQNFASVFEICYRQGGNMRDVIKNTHSIISDKMEIETEIQTKLTANKMEQNIMSVMPIMIVAMMKGMSPEFADNYVSPTGLATTTICIGIFIGAYFIGKSLLKIEV